MRIWCLLLTKASFAGRDNIDVEKEEEIVIEVLQKV
jgi:hypothetical protein